MNWFWRRMALTSLMLHAAGTIFHLVLPLIFPSEQGLPRTPVIASTLLCVAGLLAVRHIGSEPNEQLVLDFFDVLSSGDLEALRQFYHERSVWEPKVKDIAGAGKHIGMDIIDKFLAPVRGMFEPGDPKVHVQNMFSAGPWVCVESYSTGKTLDGLVYENDYCWVFEVSNGKIDKMREYMDSHYTAKLFGMD